MFLLVVPVFPFAQNPYEQQHACRQRLMRPHMHHSYNSMRSAARSNRHIGTSQLHIIACYLRYDHMLRCYLHFQSIFWTVCLVLPLWALSNLHLHLKMLYPTDSKQKQEPKYLHLGIPEHHCIDVQQRSRYPNKRSTQVKITHFHISVS